ncbi:MAG TPA: molybdopterin-dependent oxidoreductase, partial [Gemmatimonadota bacterium]|nr:molybdopterin-dependent oxidoreductase [Gemmatimonadota bacterium]
QLRTRNIEPKAVMGRDLVTQEIRYFADRCILCTRCVRFMEEIAGDAVLQVINRGHRGFIDTMTGEVFEHAFSMNIVDVCPVGALVDEDFLFKARSWDLDQTASICPGCSQGCNVSLGTKENRVLRAKPRHNPEVNSYWMCDHGRKRVVNWGTTERAEVPMVREDGGLKPVDWGRAINALVDGLRDASGKARAVVSPFASNESLYAVRKLMDRVGFAGGAFRVDNGHEEALTGFPKLRLRSERAPNARGAEILGFRRSDDAFAGAADHRGVLFVLEDALDGAPEGFGENASLFVFIGDTLSAAARRAHIVLPSPTFAEMDGTFTNFEGRVQRFAQATRAPGLARPLWLAASAVLARLDGGGELRTAAAAFAALAGEYEAYGGLSYEELGFHGANVADARSATTAAS